MTLEVEQGGIPRERLRILLLARLLVLAIFVVAALSWVVAISAMFFAGAIHTGLARAIAIDGGALLALAASVAWLARRLETAWHEIAQAGVAMHRLRTAHSALAEGLENGVVTLAEDGRIRSANPAAQRILGQGAASLLGRRIETLLPLLEGAEALGEGFFECDQRLEGGRSRRLRVRRISLGSDDAVPTGELVFLQEKDSRAAEPGEVSRGPERSPGLLLESTEPGEGLVGSGVAMDEVRRLVSKVARADATVLVCGESGTGKELVAEAIHNESARNSGPFVVVNCGAIPEGLVESELFGHVRGAFTGAEQDRPGFFRRAHGGTIFLDEIGELAPALQVRLLRVLQERQVVPVGGRAPVGVDVRVLAATNRVLEDCVREGIFREDLFYRLAVITIDVPPLRERLEDLPELIRHFAALASARHGRRILGVSERAMQALLAWRYPGNVRELANAIEHGVTLAESELLEVGDLPEAMRPTGSEASPRSAADPLAGFSGQERVGSAATPAGDERFPPVVPIDSAAGETLDQRLESSERDLILEALDRAGGVRKRAAVLLGINYRSLRHRLQKYGLPKPARQVSADSFGNPKKRRIDGFNLPK